MSTMLPRKVEGIPSPYLIVCEGYGDARLIKELLDNSKISNCSVGCPSEEGGHGTGDSAIQSYLQGVRAIIQSGKATLAGLLVIGDADDDGMSRFEKISNALTSAAFTAPSKPFSVEGADPKTGVYVIPGSNRTGTLEDLLWEAAIAHNPNVENCVQSFANCAGGRMANASPNHQAKMKMSMLVGASCAKNPWASPAMIWSQKDNPVPISSKSFKELSDFIVAFVS